MIEAIRRSVLLCDDERDLAEELGEFLADVGWAVSVCHSGSEAEQLLVGGLAPTCLLTDLRLGDMDGTSLIQLARGLPEPIRPRFFVVMTGNIIGCAAKSSMGADLLCLKPIDPAVLAEEMQEMFQRFLPERRLPL